MNAPRCCDDAYTRGGFDGSVAKLLLLKCVCAVRNAGNGNQQSIKLGGCNGCVGARSARVEGRRTHKFLVCSKVICHGAAAYTPWPVNRPSILTLKPRWCYHPQTRASRPRYSQGGSANNCPPHLGVAMSPVRPTTQPNRLVQPSAKLGLINLAL